MQPPIGLVSHWVSRHSSTGVFAMRILSKRQLKELVLYSPQHVQRLENAGVFPKRIRLGKKRVGWLEQEVYEWLQQRIDARDEPTDTAP